MTTDHPAEHRPKLEQGLGIASLALLLLASFLVMRPFISSLLWALVLSFSLWPIQSLSPRLFAVALPLLRSSSRAYLGC